MTWGNSLSRYQLSHHVFENSCTLTTRVIDVYFLFTQRCNAKQKNKSRTDLMESSAARLSCATMGGFEKPPTSVCRNPTDQRNTRLQETACHNITTTIPVFRDRKASADCWHVVPICWMQPENSLPTGFNFIMWVHAARWCTAASCQFSCCRLCLQESDFSQDLWVPLIKQPDFILLLASLMEVQT